MGALVICTLTAGTLDGLVTSPACPVVHTKAGLGCSTAIRQAGQRPRPASIPLLPYLRAREERKNCQRGQLFTVFRSQDRKMGQACASLAEAVL